MTNESSFIYDQLGRHCIQFKGEESKTQRGQHCLSLPVCWRVSVCCLEELKLGTRSIKSFEVPILKYMGVFSSFPLGQGEDTHTCYRVKLIHDPRQFISWVASESWCRYATCRLLCSCCTGSWAQQISTPATMHCELPVWLGDMLPSVMVFFPHRDISGLLGFSSENSLGNSWGLQAPEVQLATIQDR